MGTSNYQISVNFM